MKKALKKTINGILFLSVYAFLSTSFFDREPSFQRGAARGITITVLILFLLIIVLSAYRTRKFGGSWSKVRRNIKDVAITIVSSAPFNLR